MNADLVILGTDTDAGKTTFALLWLACFSEYAYWKPIETGPSDSDKVRALVPGTEVHGPVMRFAEPVAPPLAARREQATIPAAAELASRRPQATPLLIETFGSPYSPLNENESQIELIRRLNTTGVLITSSALGAIGRTLQCWHALEAHGMRPNGVALVGPLDGYAVEQLGRFLPDIPVIDLTPPEEWTEAGVRAAAERQRDKLTQFRAGLSETPALTEDWLERDRRAVWHPYTPLVGAEPPLVCTGARDEFLELADGRRIIDGISSWWTILHGHRPTFLLDALREGLTRFDHVLFAGVTHAPGIELAELMLSTLPWQPESVSDNRRAGSVSDRSHPGLAFYSDNGSTAVEVALKMAYQYWCHRGEPERLKFVGFEHGYHGDTFGAMSVSRDPLFFGRFEPLLFQADILPIDANRLAEHLKRAKVAAVILEPLVQGAGGMRMHTPETLREIVRVTQEHGVLFIADEVMTGGGRTGTLWAHTAAGVIPDLVCAGKTLAGGILPLAVTLAAPHVVEAFTSADRGKTFFHGHSFTAHPLACHVAVANWKRLVRGIDAPRRMEDYWRWAVPQCVRHPRVRDIRIRGTIAAVEIDCPGGYLAPLGREMYRAALAEGVLLRPLGNVLYAMPPLCTSADSLWQIAQAMRKCVAAVK